MCTEFGVNSSSRFPVRARTNRQREKQTDATERPTHTGGYTAGVGKKACHKNATTAKFKTTTKVIDGWHIKQVYNASLELTVCSE